MHGHDIGVGICAALNKLRFVDVGCQRKSELGVETVELRENLRCLWVGQCQFIKERRHGNGLTRQSDWRKRGLLRDDGVL